MRTIIDTLKEFDELAKEEQVYPLKKSLYDLAVISVKNAYYIAYKARTPKLMPTDCIYIINTKVVYFTNSQVEKRVKRIQAEQEKSIIL